MVTMAMSNLQALESLVIQSTELRKGKINITGQNKQKKIKEIVWDKDEEVKVSDINKIISH